MTAYTDWAVGNLVSADNLNSRLVEEHLAINTITSDSATYDDTPEVSLYTVTASVISGELYAVWALVRVSTGTAASITGLRIREDSGITGTQLNFANYYLATTTGNGYSCYIYARFTAASTASKTFSLTGQCTAGAVHVHQIRASANSPGLLVVDRVLN